MGEERSKGHKIELGFWKEYFKNSIVLQILWKQQRNEEICHSAYEEPFQIYILEWQF